MTCICQRINFDTWEKKNYCCRKRQTSLSHVFFAHPALYRHVTLPSHPFSVPSKSSWKAPWYSRHSPGGYDGDKLSHPVLLKTTDSFRIEGTFKFTDYLFTRGRCIILSPLFSHLKCCSFERPTCGFSFFLVAYKGTGRSGALLQTTPAPWCYPLTK